MHTAHAPRVLIFHSCANFCLFSRLLLKGFGLFVQFLAFLQILKDLGIFFTYFVCKLFRLEVLRVLFCNLFPSLNIPLAHLNTI